MNRSQAITRLTSIIDIRNAQMARLKVISKELKELIRMGEKAENKLLELDDNESLKEIFPQSLHEAMDNYDARTLTEDTIYDYLDDPDSKFRQLNVEKTIRKVLAEAEDDSNYPPRSLPEAEYEDDDELDDQELDDQEDY